MFEINSYKGSYKVSIIDEFNVVNNEGDIIVIDQYIWENYFNCRYGDIKGQCHIVYADENAKTLEQVERILDYMAFSGFNKSNKLIAIGGGVIQDLVSFTASIYSRGVDWVFYPTTLLAQCDSCIGSKTSINYKDCKNKLGGFHPPKEIFIYRKFLDTLPESEIKSGIGEMLHYFLINHKIDLSEKMVNDKNILINIEEYIKESLSIKKAMIEKDEFDKGERNLFNYGHTFGHAIETLSNYEVNHGQAVTMGMDIANKISLQNGLISQPLYDKIHSILLKNMPDYKIEDIEEYVKILMKDKKNTDINKLTCILLDMEYAKKVEVFYDEVRSVL